MAWEEVCERGDGCPFGTGEPLVPTSNCVVEVLQQCNVIDLVSLDAAIPCIRNQTSSSLSLLAAKRHPPDANPAPACVVKGSQDYHMLRILYTTAVALHHMLGLSQCNMSSLQSQAMHTTSIPKLPPHLPARRDFLC